MDFSGGGAASSDRKGYQGKARWERACEGPGCTVVYKTQYARSRFHSPACKRAFERDVRRRGKAANLSPEMAERAERAEAAHIDFSETDEGVEITGLVVASFQSEDTA